MSKQALIVLAEGFEEVEAIAPIDVLRRAEIEVVMAGTNEKVIKSARNVEITADITLDEVQGLPDAIILPGGFQGSTNLGASEELISLLKKMNQAGKIIAAICAAPALALTPAGVLDGKKATCYPGCEAKFKEATTHVKDRVKVDGNVITSQGPGTALEFSLEIVKQLAGEEKASELKEALLIKA